MPGRERALGLDDGATCFANIARGGVGHSSTSSWLPRPHRKAYSRRERLFWPQRQLRETVQGTTMGMTQQGRAGAVGIDGSRAALDAATWAVTEAVSLGVPLRLVHV